MSKKIICVGRGGTGKSSFIAALAYVFKDKKPLLLLDADPDESLASSFGIKDEVKSISDVLFNIKEGKISKSVESMTLPEKIDYLLQQESVYEGDFFDFLSLGVKWSEGCYCQPNSILKGIITRLSKNYNFVLIDSPAGIEHINRRITNSVDYIFVLIDPSHKSLDGAIRFKRLLEELKIKYDKMFLIANFRYPESDLALIKKVTGADALGILPYDKEIEALNLKGGPFSGLSLKSGFLSAVRDIVKKAQIV